MERHTDNVQDLSGNAVTGVTVTVRRSSDNGLASIFSDDISPTPTPKANPFTNDADGEFFFYAVNNEYNVELTGPVVETRFGVMLFDQDNAIIRRNVGIVTGPVTNAIALGNIAAVDVTAGAVTITLPTDPGTTFQFSDIVVNHVAGDITTNNITIDRNGELIGGVASNLVLNSPNAAVRLIWAGSTLGWALQNVGPGGSLGSLTDVTLSGVATFDTLYKSAGDWLNTDALTVNPSGAVQAEFNGVLTLETKIGGARFHGTSSQQRGASDFDTRLFITTTVAGAAMQVDQTSGDMSFFHTGNSASGGTNVERYLRGVRNGALQGFHNGVMVWRTVVVGSGGLEVDNQSTGAGFERVLTTSDVPTTQIVQAVKTADETVTNSTTYQTDDHIASLVLSVNRWSITGFARWNPPTTSGGIKFRWNMTGGALGAFSDWHIIFREDVTISPSVPELGYSAVSGVTGIVIDQVGNAEATGTFHGNAEVNTSARTFNLQWAQATANATGTILHENAWMRFQRTD